MYLGDNLVVGGVTGLVEEFDVRRGGDAMVLLTRVPDPRSSGWPSSAGRPAWSAGGETGRAAQRPGARRRVPVRACGARRRRRDRAVSAAASWRSPTPSSTWSTPALAVRSHVVQGYWKDTGRVEDILDANRTMLDLLTTQVDGLWTPRRGLRRRRRRGRCRGRGSELVGPLVLGSGCTVRGSTIGPYASVGADCSLDGTHLVDSIVMAGTSWRRPPGRVPARARGRGRPARRRRGAPARHGDHGSVSARREDGSACAGW